MPLPAAAKFCIECGHPVAERAARPSPAPESYTPPHLAEKILRSKGAIEGARKQVSVLFADVKESMSLAETVDPEAWHRILDGFFAILSDGVHRFEGTINQYTGDGVMALFGAPIAHEDHAQRACYTALFLLDKLASYAEELRRKEGLNFSVRMGINSGEVIVGAIGDDLRMDYTAQGHTVGMAARMEALAAADKVYLTDDTATLVRDYFDLRDLGRFRVKGVRGQQRVYELRGVGAHRTRLDAARARGLSRFVGRHEEMERLEAALDRTRNESSQIIGIVGEGGVGKSRLCYEFTERCQAREIPVVSGHCVAHGKMIPFLPVLQILRAHLGIEETDSARAAREKIAGRLLLVDPGLADALPVVFDFLGVPDPQKPAPSLDPEPLRHVLYGALEKMVQAHEEEMDVIVVEDLQWIDGASEAFLAHYIEMLQERNCLLLLNFRPEYRPQWADRPFYQQIELGPLGDDALVELCKDLLGTHESTVALAENIRVHTAGNPFFIEEIVRALVEAGSLEGKRGKYRLTRPVEDVILPPTVESLLAARIDHLGEQDKTVLETAAVIGKEFAEPVLRRVTEVSDTDLAISIDHLREKGFVYEREVYPEVEYAFSHPLTQEVAYRSQLSERREHVHGRVARVITEFYADKLDEQAALLAVHWKGAGEFLEAAKARRRAADHADTKDVEAAHRHWKKLVGLLDRIPESSEKLELAVAAAEGILSVCWRLGLPRKEADEAFRRGKKVAAASGDPTAQAKVLLAYATVKTFAGELERALEVCEEASVVLAESDDLGLRLALTGRRAYLNMLAGNLTESLEIFDQNYELAGGENRHEGVPAGDHIFMYGMRALPLLYLGELDDAGRVLERGIERGLQAGELGTVNALRGFAVTHAWFRGDAPTALALARAQVEYADGMPSIALKASAYDSLGVANMMTKQWDDAVSIFENALRLSRDSGTLLQSEALLLANMAEAYRGSGQYELARGYAEEAMKVARKRGTAMHECRANLFLGRVLVRSDNGSSAKKAEKPLKRALAIVEKTGARAYEPFVRVELAALALKRGDDKTFDRHCERACELFSEIGAAAHAESLDVPGVQS